MKKYAIIGFGCAGYNGAKALRAHAPDAAIHVFDNSGAPPFSPMLSTYHAAGKLPYEAVFPFGTLEDIAKELKLDIIGETVVEVSAERTITTDQATYENYDGILLATGADALVPGFLTCTGEKWFLMRTLKDAQRLRSYLDTNTVRTAAVVGGSMVGIKVAELLHAAGVKVTIVDAAPYLFPLAAYRSTAEAIQRKLEEKGVAFAFDAKVSAIDEAGVTFADGAKLEADLVCLCIGTRANVDVLRPSGVNIGRAVVVDEHMESSVKGIYAAGDCCEGRNLQTGKTAIIGLWANAGAQGACAGANMAGVHTEYHGNILHNITHFFDMDFIGLGDASVQGEHHRFEGKNFSIELVMDAGQLKSVNIFGNYKISGILKHHLTKQLLGAESTLTPAQRGLLEQHGLPRDFIELIGGASHD